MRPVLAEEASKRCGNSSEKTTPIT